MNSSKRYHGKPLLRLLELYVLNAIDYLTEEDAEVLLSMGPELTETFGFQGDWNSIIERVMNFPDDMTEQIKVIWMNNFQELGSNPSYHQAQEFAEQFVDCNFM